VSGRVSAAFPANFHEFQRDIVVIGASAGGVSALKQLVSELPAEFPASIFIVQHTASVSPGLMAGILESRCALPVSFPRDSQKIEVGHVYVAPPDRHLVLDHGEVLVTSGPEKTAFDLPLMCCFAPPRSPTGRA
jgi:two-component system chemotaxis response regulator CheB